MIPSAAQRSNSMRHLSHRLKREETVSCCEGRNDAWTGEESSLLYSDHMLTIDDIQAIKTYQSCMRQVYIAAGRTQE